MLSARAIDTLQLMSHLGGSPDQTLQYIRANEVDLHGYLNMMLSDDTIEHLAPLPPGAREAWATEGSVRHEILANKDEAVRVLGGFFGLG